MEAAYFAEAIAFRATHSFPREHAWRLGGLAVAAGRNDGVSHAGDFERRFTGRVGGLTMLARAEGDLEVRLPARDPVVVPAGAEFRFHARTCWLSGGGPDRVEFLVNQWELTRRCWPFGAIPFGGDDDRPVGRPEVWPAFTIPAHGNLPWRWVTHHRGRRGESEVWAPVPRFEWNVIS